MKNAVITSVIIFFIINTFYAQNSKYPQKLENDICSNLIIGSFVCNGCAQSDRDLVDDVREDVIEALKKFKYCLVLNRDKLTDIIEEGDNENNIGMLNEEQRIKLRQIYQAERILFGKLKPQSNGSMLVTIEINNLSTTDQEGFERFVIPDDKYKNYETRQPFVEKGIVDMLLGADAKTNESENTSFNNSNENSNLDKNGLIAYYPFNGNALDMSGNNMHGTALGDIFPSNDRFGNSKSAFYFDGKDDCVVIPNNESLTPNQFTFTMWINISNQNPGNWMALIGKWDDSNTSNGSYAFALNDFGRIHTAIKIGNSCNDDNDWMRQPYPFQWNIGTWNQVCMTYNGSVQIVYHNGVEIGRKFFFANPGNCNGGDMKIGGSIWQMKYRQFYKGLIDDVRIYNRALDTDEIKSLYREEMKK